MEDQSATASAMAYTAPTIVSRQRIEALLALPIDGILSDNPPK